VQDYYQRFKSRQNTFRADSHLRHSMNNRSDFVNHFGTYVTHDAVNLPSFTHVQCRYSLPSFADNGSGGSERTAGSRTSKDERSESF